MPSRDFFRLGSAWVFMSLQSGCGASRPNSYFIGQLNESSHTFEASAATPLFPSSFAGHKFFGYTIAKSAGGPNGRRLMWGAVWGLPASGIPNPASSIPNATEVHIGSTMSLGQELSLASDGTLEFRFLPELQALREGAATKAGSGRLLEIQAEFSNASSAGLSLFGGCVRLQYDASRARLAFSGQN